MRLGGRAAAGQTQSVTCPEGRRWPRWVSPQAASAPVTVTIRKVSYLPSLGVLFIPVSLHSLPSCFWFLVVSTHCHAPRTALGVPHSP